MALAAGSTALTFAATGVYISNVELSRFNESYPSDQFLLERSVAQIEGELVSVKLKLEEIESSLNHLSEIPDEAASALKFEKIDNQMSSIREDLEILTTIETAITANPERAMSIPILRRDVDAYKQNATEDLAATRQEIDRLYGLSQWFMGLMGTMAIGMISIAVTNVFRASKN